MGRDLILQTVQGGKRSVWRDDFTDCAMGTVVGGKRRDVTDSAKRNVVVREKRDVTDIARGKLSVGRDVVLQKVKG